MIELGNLQGTTDALAWAEAFVHTHGGDIALMTAWFANAIRVGEIAGREAAEQARG